MEKSIMSLADDILGGALTNPAKAQSALSNPYNEPELPELSDDQRDFMMNEFTEPAPGEVRRQAAHTASRGQRKGSPGFRDTRASGSASTGHTAQARKELAQSKGKPSAIKAKRDSHKGDINKSRRERGATELAHLTSDQKLILQQARDIIREMTSVGAIGTGPQVTGPRAFSTHGATMGKDTVPVKPVDKSMRKVEKGKASKKKAKKVKKESFELFLDRILNEHLGDK